MAKSIKPQNNIYIDSSGITHNRTLLSNLLERNFATKLDLYVGDGDTKTIAIEKKKVYLYINSHLYERCMLFLTFYNDILNIDTIFKSSDSAVPTITIEGNALTIKGTPHSRGYLFKINDLNCG